MGLQKNNKRCMIKNIGLGLGLAVGLFTGVLLSAEENKDAKNAPLMCKLPTNGFGLTAKECDLKNKPEEKQLLFSVDSEDLDPAESLNRISGLYETEELPEDTTFKSKDHGRVDPLHGRSYEDVSQ